MRCGYRAVLSMVVLKISNAQRSCGCWQWMNTVDIEEIVKRNQECRGCLNSFVVWQRSRIDEVSSQQLRPRRPGSGAVWEEALAMIACEYASHISQAQLIRAVCLLGHVRNKAPQKTTLRDQLYIFEYRSCFHEIHAPWPIWTGHPDGAVGACTNQPLSRLPAGTVDKLSSWFTSPQHHICEATNSGGVKPHSESPLNIFFFGFFWGCFFFFFWKV